MVLNADFVHRIDQRGDILRIDVWCDPVAEVEYMAAAIAEVGQYVGNLPADGFRIGGHDRRIHIALQGNPVADLFPGCIQVDRPVEAECVSTAFREFRKP